MKIWERLLSANSLIDLSVAAAIALAVFLALWIARDVVRRVLLRYARSTDQRWDDALADAASATRLWVLLLLALYAGASSLELPPWLDRFVENLAMVALIAQFAIWATRLLANWLSLRADVARSGVTYETPAEKLRALPGWLKAAVDAQPTARFDRAHFKEYADFSLNFEIVYYVLSPDYNTYMDTQQAINFAIFDKLAQEGVQFAYPTRTLYLRQEAAAGS